MTDEATPEGKGRARRRRRKGGKAGFGCVFRRGDSWHVRIRRKGKRDYRKRVASVLCSCPQPVTRCACGMGRPLAEAALAKVRIDWEREGVLGVKQVGRVTVADFWPKVEDVVASRVTDAGIANAISMIRTLDEKDCPIRGKAIADLTVADAQALVAWLREGRKVGAATANRYLSFCSSLFQLAAERDCAGESNPFRKVKKSREQERPVPFIGIADARRIEAHAPEEFRPFLAILSECGLRRGEAKGLAWCDVDLAGRRLVVRRSKSRRVRTLPLTRTAVAALEEARRTGPPVPMRGEAPVFPEVACNTVTKKLPGWAKAAGLPKLRLHDLRHGWACRLIAGGVSAVEVQRLGGWASLSMVQRYANAVPAGTEDRAIAALEGRAQEPRKIAADRPVIVPKAAGAEGMTFPIAGEEFGATSEGPEACAAEEVARPGGVEPPTLRSVEGRRQPPPPAVPLASDTAEHRATPNDTAQGTPDRPHEEER